MKKWIAFAIAFLMAASVLAACTPTFGSDRNHTFTDDLDREVRLNGMPKKVVALMGSYAETWLLAGGALAGTTSDAVDERKLDLGEDVQIVGTVKEPNLEQVLALSPDFVILSADIQGHVKAGETLEAAGIPHAYFKVELFSDYLSMLQRLTGITGREDLYESNGLAVQRQIDEVLAGRPDERPTVLFIRAFSTGAKAKGDDNMTGAMLKDLGADNIAARHASLLEEISMEEIIAEDPDFILVTTMGGTEEALAALKESVQQNPAWNELSAVKNDRYIVLPKDLFHYKPNARWGEAYEELAKILYP
ncbi:ABC transporter substrate-binding protein [Gehongia tenuis]|uniref:ABC transporter substrate-binding protein n=1 Tax=Gehongia tenuis TaxID=2763655 RepID=A0A926D520_9FIRM|nr:ABC transporter substrate-binding protein [Gehongia tenuis]MBC8531721.1 ABC transporter substrate-binding protein [Gehongia tenuis]